MTIQRQVTQVLHRINKHPLLLIFFIDLEPTDFSQGIQGLQTGLLITYKN